jgi:3-deoxy-D-manno-octulosonate 8-phosphate phosphatase KdsC-like HAD superfamily phosphatase
MRFREFKPLLENVDIATKNALSSIEDLKRKLSANPEQADLVAKEIDAIVDDVVATAQNTSTAQTQPVVQKPQPPNTAQQNNQNYDKNVIGQDPVSEDGSAVMGTANAFELAMSELNELTNLIKSGKIGSKAVAEVSRRLNNLRNSVTEIPKQTASKITQAQANFEDQLSAKVDRLIDKVFDTLEILPTDKEKEGKKVTPEMKQAAATKAKDSSNTRKSATRLVKGIISDLSTGIQDPEQRAAKQQQVLSFLDKLFVGILDMEALLMTPQSSLDHYVEKEDPIMVEFYHEIVDELIGSAPITTAGAWGPAELALAVLGKPASKSQDKGDVKVGLKKIEVKAAKESTAGGRIGGNGVNNGGTMASNYKGLLNNFVSDVFGKKYQVNNPKANDYLFKYSWVNNKNQTKTKVTAPTGVGMNWFNSFNQKIATLRNPKVEKVKEFVLELVKLGIKEDYWGVIDKNAVLKSVNPNGTIDYQKLWKAYAISTFKAYQVADGVDTIMMLNSETRTYTLFNDSKQLSQLMKSGVIVPNPTLMAFSGQTSLGPQLGIK